MGGLRLWTLHPRYLDARGLVAAWREGLLAQQVLLGVTRGYTRHPQLLRFREHSQPLEALGAFLTALADEACTRGYSFDVSKILHRGAGRRLVIVETRGQLLHEWQHLCGKLARRAPDWHLRFQTVALPKPHPLFRIVPGNVRPWEKAEPAAILERGSARLPGRATLPGP